MKVGHVVEVKLLDRPPSKGLGSEVDEVVAVAVEIVAEADVAFAELSGLSELVELVESSVLEALLVAVEVVEGTVITNVEVTELAANALLRRSFSAESNMVHLPWSRRTGICVSSKSVSAKSGAAVGSGSALKRGEASVCEARDTARHRVAAHCIRGL